MPAQQLPPEVISQLVGSPQTANYKGVGYSPAQQNNMQGALQQQGVYPGDSGPKGDLLARLMEVERTRRLADPKGNADSAEQVRRGTDKDFWFMPDLNAVLAGGR